MFSDAKHYRSIGIQALTFYGFIDRRSSQTDHPEAIIKRAKVCFFTLAMTDIVNGD